MKRQQQYVTWRSQIQRCFGMDEQIFNTEFRRIQNIAGLLKEDAYHRQSSRSLEVALANSSDDQYATLDFSRQAGIDFDNLWGQTNPSKILSPISIN
jgi:hypothetical protein